VISRSVLGGYLDPAHTATDPDPLTDIDFLYSDKDNADKPISCGFYRLEKGTPLVYTYTYDEMKIILEGQFQITDETGQTVTASPGDVFYFPKGAKITFTTEDYGLAFYVSDRVFLTLRMGDHWGNEC
jgi:ethanolamine utilization protein EutQ (cupin superfamily)